MNAQLRIQKLMQADLAAAQARNPAYSLRAFALKIGLYSSTVSEILSGRRKITRKMAARILQGLGTPPDESTEILSQLAPRTRRATAHRAGDSASPALAYAQIDMDQFHVISDWYYFAILSLADTQDFHKAGGEPEWVARRLAIKPQEARVALERLERLGMLARDRRGRLCATGKQFATSADISNLSLRKHHYQNLELARRSLDRDPVQEREFTFINMAVDPERMPEMKERIREFRDALCAEFESGARREVYKMCVQLFPLTSPETKGESS